MLTYTNKIEQDLRREMDFRHLEPMDEMIFDGQCHEYWAFVNGEYKQAYYSVTICPFDVDGEGSTLVACYGLHDGEEHCCTYVFNQDEFFHASAL